jgi:hypothetical protein
MATQALPESVEQLTPQLLNSLIQEQYPAVVLEDFTIVKSLKYGDGMVSTAARAILDLHYKEGTGQGLPTRVILKLAYDLEDLPWPLYANEVRFYKELRSELDLEIPVTLGAAYDHDSHRFLLLIEDLTVKGAVFPNVLRDNTLQEIKNILSVVAGIHATYWESPRFSTDLADLETHVGGALNDFLVGPVINVIDHEISTNPLKQELMYKLNMTSEQMLAGMKAMQKHQATLPQTVLHGDTHIGNTYILPDGAAGLLDLQLFVRGYCMHDINYLITTALPIHLRREHEQSLLKYYLSELAAKGVATVPTFDSAWKEYKRTLIWGVYIGWMTCAEENYGWEIQALNLLRLTTAFVDHDTAALVAEVM